MKARIHSIPGSKAVSLFLDLIYPPSCVSCDSTLTAGADIFCPYCSEHLVQCSPVSIPRPAPCLSHATSFFEHGGPASAAINMMKYSSRIDVASKLAVLFSSLAAGFLRYDGTETVVPVPLHPSRMRKRGFNQSAILARSLARNLSLDYSPGLLARVRDTPPQAGLTKKDRARNIKGAFACSFAPPAKVILVDDVYTTGSTARECAITLIDAGTEEVGLVTFTRA